MPKLLRLTPAQHAFWQENGYLHLPGFLSPAEVDEARQRMVALLRDPDAAHPRVRFHNEPPESVAEFPPDPENPRRTWMIMDTPLAGDWWFRQFQHPAVLDVLTDCLGPNLNFHNGKARIKPPGYRTHLGWHQDWPYERHSVPELAAALTYLDDTWEGAAATHVIPGSHRSGEWAHDAQNLIPEDEVVARVGPERAAGVPLCAKAGDVVVIHVLVVHRAGENRTGSTRSCIINEYKTLEAIDRWGNPCAFADLPLRRDGRPFVV
jgi:phytanoyl-CoA hydroxylase